MATPPPHHARGAWLLAATLGALCLPGHVTGAEPAGPGPLRAVDQGTLPDAALWRSVSPGLTVAPHRLLLDAREVAPPPPASVDPAAAPPGTWRELPPPGRIRALAIYDSLADEIVVSGPSQDAGRIVVWALRVEPPGTWVRRVLPVTLPRLGPLAGSTVDPAGGTAFFVERGDWKQVGAVVEVRLAGEPAARRFETPTTGEVPSWRSDAMVVFDSRRQRLVLYGGSSSDLLDDAWSFDLATREWSRLVTQGGPIAARAAALAVYDPDRDRMLVLGGWLRGLHDTVTRTDETWSLEFGDSNVWRAIPSGGEAPVDRAGECVVRNPVDGALLVVGGIDRAAPGGPGDVFRFSEGAEPAWERWSPEGASSRPRIAGAAVVDTRRGRILLFGGAPAPSDRVDVDVLTLAPVPAWSPLGHGALPPPRFGHGMTIDTKRDRLVMFGGVSSFSTPIGWTSTYLGDTWSAPLERPNEWAPLATGGPAPPPRLEPVVVYDPLGDRVVMFGGWRYPDQYFGDTWVLTLAGEPLWAQVDPAGESPPARRASAAVLDPLRDRLLLFFGFGDRQALDDVWALRLDGAVAWERLSPRGEGPSGRGFHSATYDPARDRVLLHGGSVGSRSVAETWVLRLGDLEWGRLETGGYAPALSRHTAVLDMAGERLLVHGGFDIDYDLISFPSGVVQELELQPEPRWRWRWHAEMPDARLGHATVSDSRRARLVTFGGSDFGSVANDTWLFEFGPARFDGWLIGSHVEVGTATLTWQLAGTPVVPVRVERSSIREPWHVVGSVLPDGRDRIRFQDRGLAAGWPYRYRLAGPTGPLSHEAGIVSAGAPPLQVLGGWPNPGLVGSPRVRIALASTAPATVELFDLSGRKVSTDRLVPGAPGIASLEPHGELRPGVYFVRLTQDGRSATGKLCLVR